VTAAGGWDSAGGAGRSGFPELVADLAGVGVVQVIEDGQCLLQGTAGGGVLSGRVPGVRETGQGFSPELQIVVVTEDIDGLLVAGDGFAVLAQEMVGVAEAAQGNALASLVP
jgi:hypothetical protein